MLGNVGADFILEVFQERLKSEVFQERIKSGNLVSALTQTS